MTGWTSRTLLLGLLGLALLSSPLQAAPPDSVPVTVINPEPIPVQGAISADVSGQVEVTSGAIDVNSLPDSLTDQLDTLADQLDELIDNSMTAAPPANFSMVIRHEGDTETFDLGAQVLVSLITLSTENDRGALQGLPDATGPCCKDDELVLAIGETNKEFPGTLVIPFPQSLSMRRLRWVCFNVVEDCEISITVVGTVLN